MDESRSLLRILEFTTLGFIALVQFLKREHSEQFFSFSASNSLQTLKKKEKK